jgi:hypothetical protein
LFYALTNAEAVPPTLAVFFATTVGVHRTDALFAATAATEGSLFGINFTTGASVAKTGDTFASALAAATATPVITAQFACTVRLANHASASFAIALNAFAAAPATAIAATFHVGTIGSTDFTDTIYTFLTVAAGRVAIHALQGVVATGVFTRCFCVASVKQCTFIPTTNAIGLNAVDAVKPAIAPNHATQVIAAPFKTYVATVNRANLTITQTIIGVLGEGRGRNQHGHHQNCRPNSSHCFSSIVLHLSFIASKLGSRNDILNLESPVKC